MKISKNKIKRMIKKSIIKETGERKRGPRKLKLKQLGIPHKLEPNPGNNGDMALVKAAIKLHQQFGQPIDRELINAQTNQEILRYYQDNYHYNSGNAYANVYSRHILPPFGDTVFKMLNSRIRDVSKYMNKQGVLRRLRTGDIYPSFYEGLRSQGIKGQAFRDAEEKIIEGLSKLARHRIKLLSAARDLVDGQYTYGNYSMTRKGDPMTYITDWLIEMQEILYEYNISYHMP